MVKRLKLELEEKFRSDNYRLRHTGKIRALYISGAAPKLDHVTPTFRDRVLFARCN